MGNEALKPDQLVVEFRSRLRIPIGEVDGSDQDSLNSRFDVAGLVIFSISRQACAGQHGSVVSRENGHAIPGTLSLPDCFVPESSKGIHGKGSLLRLELLETNHVRLSFGQPSQEVIQPLIDVVNVEGRDSQQTQSLSLPLGAPRKRSNRVLCSGWHHLTDGKSWKTPN